MKWLAVALVTMALLGAAPFWETKAPADWTEDELITLFTNSPWAQMVEAPAGSPAPPVQVYLATAGPMQQGEAERDRRYRRKRPHEQTDEMTLEYRAWLRENGAQSIVLAIAIPKGQDALAEQDSQRMEDECVMHVGRRKFKMTGHFPPTGSDPYLRLAFPRQVKESDKSVSFDLYLPGVPIPYRSVEFRVKDMIMNGKLEI
ncbi:MAG TPA: hypothetical protein VMB85_03520 [Bryobacteraceae bacterium]|nr:hypothetical protein [Bryobacteraceae bacterium]